MLQGLFYYTKYRRGRRVQSTENRANQLTSLIFGCARCKNSSELGFYSLARKFSLAGEGVAATQSMTREWKKEEKQKVERKKQK